MKVVSAEDAVSRIQSGMKVMLPPACGEPRSLMAALVEHAESFEGLTLMGGLLLTDYKFIECANFKFVTWHVMPGIKKAVAEGDVEFLPIRYSDVIPTFSRSGPWPADYVLLQTSPPDDEGFLSLGVSVSYPLPLAQQDDVVVIAEVNSRMPRTMGNSRIHSSKIDFAVESEVDLVEYPSPGVGDVERQIAGYVEDLIPDGATIQAGIGSIPEAIIECLHDKKDLRAHAMIVDNFIGLMDEGVVKGVDATELMGTSRLWEYVHENPAVNMEPASYTHNVKVISGIDKFISINSAVEVDLQGQVNAEAVEGIQMSGIGGHYDFVQGALLSPGGKSIIAITSTASKGTKSRIVPVIKEGNPISTQRHSVDYVITEHGVAALRGRSLSQRAKALISIAHPDFQAGLEEHAKSKGLLK